MKKILINIVFLLLLSGTFFSQENTDTTEVVVPGEEYILGMFPKKEPAPLRQISINGFYRFFSTYTDMKAPYLLVPEGDFYTRDRTLFIGDDTQLPNLWMNVSGRPNAKTSFGMDFFMFQFLNGQLDETYGTQVVDSLRPPIYDPRSGTRLGTNFGLNLGINLYGTYQSKLGSFKASMGGTHWYYLSDLTFASFRGYNRFTLFERNPWDPVEKSVGDRYAKFYNEGETQQDLRWGNRAFHGLIIEGMALPEDFSFSLLYGKTELNGGIVDNPNISIGGRIKKENTTGFVSYNTFNSRTYTDSLNTASVGFNVHTFEARQKIGDYKVHFEVGGGRYYSPSYGGGWGEALNIKLTTPKKLTGIPIEFQVYRIAPEVVNNNAIFWNTSVDEANNSQASVSETGATQVLTPFASSVVPIGLMTNNRTGLNLNAEKTLGKLKLAGGLGFSSEIKALSNSITFSHTVNRLTRSRFWRWNFTPNVGPYNRYSVVYRDAYETVNLSDDNGSTLISRNHFSSAEIQAKYKSKLFNKDIYMMFLGRYYSVQPKFSPILVTNEDAYLRQYSSEFEIYYRLNSKFMFSNYFGYERVLGNYNTDTDNDLVAGSGRPRNQEGVGLGSGFELSLGKNSVFIFRHRVFAFQDFSFKLDQFKGSESLAEIKVFF
ncbi:MAG: hypothetical protein ACI8XB_001803 [Patiriisocius sp.]|jgi:hypothetical protein